MRFRLAAAALAALALATPAAAQPNPVAVLQGVMRQLSANTEGVEDYTLTLRAGPSANEASLDVVPAGQRVVMTGVMDSMTSWTENCPLRGPGASFDLM